ncbi:hypothetical protein CCUS01_15671 [Colletotrichum cuscutae]|uniref:Uncharacterized protein n=1 Tax=Colletotrichum cuscutae TaxID=1209917 RepID=A0AAI9Y5E0_9PEZI|nr:hypothetical protein CCUS01_15671 [Colletotrichum cuscutae]
MKQRVHDFIDVSGREATLISPYLLAPQTIVGVPKTSAHPSTDRFFPDDSAARTRQQQLQITEALSSAASNKGLTPAACYSTTSQTSPFMPPKAMIFGLESRDVSPREYRFKRERLVGFGGLRASTIHPDFLSTEYSSTACIASTCLFRNVIGRNKTPGRRSLPVAPSVTLEPADSATELKVSGTFAIQPLIPIPDATTLPREGKTESHKTGLGFPAFACYTCLAAFLPACLPYFERPSEAMASEGAHRASRLLLPIRHWAWVRDISGFTTLRGAHATFTGDRHLYISIFFSFFSFFSYCSYCFIQTVKTEQICNLHRSPPWRTPARPSLRPARHILKSPPACLPPDVDAPTLSVRPLTSSPVPAAAGKRTCAAIAGFDLPPLLYKVRMTSVSKQALHEISYRIGSHCTIEIDMHLREGMSSCFSLDRFPSRLIPGVTLFRASRITSVDLTRRAFRIQDEPIITDSPITSLDQWYSQIQPTIVCRSSE